MNVFDTLVVLGLLIVAVLSQASAQDENADLPAPKIRLICDKCQCMNDTKILNCNSANLKTLFTLDEWKVLTSANVTFDTMDFSRNDLREVPAFPELTAKTLILAYNKITKIADEAFKVLKRLEMLDLSHNALSTSNIDSNAFKGDYSNASYEPLENLKILDLGYNEFHSIPRTLFDHLPSLERLTLTGNTFKVIDAQTEMEVAGLTALKYLDLTYMELSSLPDHLLHSPRNLQILNLTGNLFNRIPQALVYAVNLQELVLDENPLEDIEGENVFPTLKTLSTLSLCYISSLLRVGKGAFSKLENLKVLKMTDNPRLGEIHPNAFCRNHDQDSVVEDYPPLEELYIHTNNLSSLDSHILARWDKLNVLDLRGNSWDCVCQNKFILEELYPLVLDKTPVLAKDVKCASPGELEGAKFSGLHEKQTKLRCADRYGNHPSRDGAILIGVLIGLLIALPVCFAAILIYRRGCFGIMGQPGPGDYSRAFYRRAELRDDFTI